MKKLAGTRAGKPFYVAVDLELAMQVGVRLFRTFYDRRGNPHT